MATKKYLSLTRLTEYDTAIKGYINSADDATLAAAKSYADGLASGKAAADHNHDDVYYTESEVDAKISAVNSSITKITNGSTVVSKATSADSAAKATQLATERTIQLTGDASGSAKFNGTADASITVTIADDSHNHIIGNVDGLSDALAGKASSTHNHSGVYDPAGSADTALETANEYTDDQIALLLNNSSEAVDSIMELAAAMEDNADAIEALEGIAAGKANATHSHAISDVTNLQTTLNAKATQSSLDSHTGNTTVHITSTERTNWNAAKTHADSAHAPSGAQANVIETIKVNGAALTPTGKAVDITVPTDYLVASDIVNKADKATTLSGYGITNAYTKTEVDNKLSTKANQSSLESVSSVANEAKSAAATNTQAISANTSAISGHTTRISALETAVGEFEEITSDDIAALFAN